MIMIRNHDPTEIAVLKWKSTADGIFLYTKVLQASIENNPRELCTDLHVYFQLKRIEKIDMEIRVGGSCRPI